MTATGDKTVSYDTREIEPVPSQAEAPRLYDWATIGLIAIGGALVLLIGLLAYTGKAVPDALGSALLLDLGALAGMVAVSRKA